MTLFKMNFLKAHTEYPPIECYLFYMWELIQAHGNPQGRCHNPPTADSDAGPVEQQLAEHQSQFMDSTQTCQTPELRTGPLHPATPARFCQTVSPAAEHVI